MIKPMEDVANGTELTEWINIYYSTIVQYTPKTIDEDDDKALVHQMLWQIFSLGVKTENDVGTKLLI